MLSAISFVDKDKVERDIEAEKKNRKKEKKKERKVGETFASIYMLAQSMIFTSTCDWITSIWRSTHH